MRRRMPVMDRVLALVGVLVLTQAGCAPDQAPPLSGTLRLFASTSLTEAFQSMAHGFETSYPGVHVDVTFAADSDLARRSAAGPAPDLIAVEGPAPLSALRLTGPAVPFARNQLILAVAAANPRRVARLADVGRPDVRVAMCADSEPCGTVTESVLSAANVPAPATAIRVADVRSALARLLDGSADVAVVYRSDARLAGDKVITVEFPESRAALAEYQAGVPADAANPRAAATFLAYLTDDATVDALTGGGFQPPAPPPAAASAR